MCAQRRDLDMDRASGTRSRPSLRQPHGRESRVGETQQRKRTRKGREDRNATGEGPRRGRGARGWTGARGARGVRRGLRGLPEGMGVQEGVRASFERAECNGDAGYYHIGFGNQSQSPICLLLDIHRRRHESVHRTAGKSPNREAAPEF